MTATTLEKIKTLIGFAYENVALYRKLYQEKPELKDANDFKKLPCLTRNDFARYRIEEILSNMDEVIAILPPIENKTIFPFPRMESANDRDSRYEVFHFFLNQAGITDGTSFLIITDTSYSYYCGEIANNLLFYKHPTWMMFLRDHSTGEILTWIDKFEPDCLLIGMDRVPDEIAHYGVHYIFTINQYAYDLSSNSTKHFDMYAVSEIGWIGLRTPEMPYVYPDGYFYMEADPSDNILVLTTLKSRLQPFIRYRTSDRGQVLEGNMFRVTYIGEH